MIFYHGTSKEKWKQIQKQGYLLNGRDLGLVPVTWLATELAEAKCYGEVILQVEYIPGTGKDNYIEGCWQLRVYTKIPLANITELFNGSKSI
ncbi:MAG TPA: hypothetical protein ENI23_16875 [bacterium]|nr:hypothetical protein [bacterium]